MLVDEVRIAGAQIVGQIADDGLFARARFLISLDEASRDAHLLAVAERVGLAVFLDV